jgi:hypothetical protein
MTADDSSSGKDPSAFFPVHPENSDTTIQKEHNKAVSRFM